MKIYKWNDNKKHRCPECRAVAVDMEKVSSWAVYTCCRCGALFTRFPRLAFLLPKRGIRCSEHKDQKSRPTYLIRRLTDGEVMVSGLSWEAAQTCLQAAYMTPPINVHAYHYEREDDEV